MKRLHYCCARPARTGNASAQTFRQADPPGPPYVPRAIIDGVGRNLAQRMIENSWDICRRRQSSGRRGMGTVPRPPPVARSAPEATRSAYGSGFRPQSHAAS